MAPRDEEDLALLCGIVGVMLLLFMLVLGIGL